MSKNSEFDHRELPAFVDHGIVNPSEVVRQEAAWAAVRDRVVPLVKAWPIGRRRAYGIVHGAIRENPANIGLRFLEAWLRKDAAECARYLGIARRVRYFRTIEDRETKFRKLSPSGPSRAARLGSVASSLFRPLAGALKRRKIKPPAPGF